MKNLMKLLFVFVLLSMTTQIYGQSITVKGGLNLSNMTAKDNDDTYNDDFKMKPGFHIGATAEFPVSETAAFETGLLLSTKGYKEKYKETYGGETYESKSSVNLLYLDIPILAKAYFNIADAKIFGALGPYIGYGLSGKSKYEYSGMGETGSEEEDIKWGSGQNDHLKRLDFGLSAGAGIEMKSIVIGLSYNLGLANISSDTSNGMKGSNRVLELSVGYKLK